MRNLDVIRRDTREGRWHIYRDKNQEYTYIVSGDSAAGLPNRDGSAACVICLETHEVVANLCGQIPPEEFAVELEKAARYYNEGEIVVEYDKYGLVVLHILRDKYTNIYAHSESLVGVQGSQSKELGWNPVKNRNRQLAVDLLKMDMGYYVSNNDVERNRSIKIFDKATLQEMNDFVRDNDSGKEMAAVGKKDDRVSAVYIGNFVWHERMQYWKPKKNEEKKETILDMMRSWGRRVHSERSLGERERAF